MQNVRIKMPEAINSAQIRESQATTIAGLKKLGPWRDTEGKGVKKRRRRRRAEWIWMRSRPPSEPSWRRLNQHKSAAASWSRCLSASYPFKSLQSMVNQYLLPHFPITLRVTREIGTDWALLTEQIDRSAPRSSSPLNGRLFLYLKGNYVMKGV